MALAEVKTRETFKLQNFEGRAINGYYLGKTETEGEFGVNVRHEFFSKEKGEKFSFWGVTDFNMKLGNVKPGTLVQFTYKGKEMRKTKKGMKEMHAVEVLNDPTDLLADFENMKPNQEPPLGDAPEAEVEVPF